MGGRASAATAHKIGPRSYRVLHLEDDARDAELIQRRLKAGLACTILWVRERDAFERAMRTETFDLVLTDYNLPDYDGRAALACARQHQPDTPIIVISGTLGEDEAVECLKAGATDYLLKGRLQRLRAAAQRALAEAESIREKRETEAALRKNEARYRALTEISPVGIFRTDREGRCEFVNRRWREITGLTTEQALGTGWLAALHPEDREKVFEEWNRAVCERRPFRAEYRFRRTDGTVTSLLGNARAEIGAHGEVLGYVGTITDLTELKVAETAIRESEARYRALVDASAQIVWAATATGEAKRLFTSWGQFTGLAESEALNDGWLNALHPGDVEPTVRLWREALRTGTMFRCEYRMRRHDGVYRHMRVRGVPVRDDDGVIQEWIGACVDITEQKQAVEHIAMLSRTHALLSGINAAIVRARDRQQLFEEACRIALEAGGFRMAWIGFVDRRTQDIVPVAHAGADEEYFTLIRPSADPDKPGGRGICGRVVRSGRSVCVRQDSFYDVNAARERGLAAAIGLPLLTGSEVVGTFTLYSAASDAFEDDEEVKLLNELASDISYALNSLEKEAQLNHVAYFDTLTGLANRTLFYDRLTQMMTVMKKGAGRAGVAIIDLDSFKSINHTMGRHGGDAAIRHSACQLQEAVGSAEMLGRVGVDSFGLIISGIAADHIPELIEGKLLRSLAAPLRLGDQELQLSAKVGIAVWPEDGCDAETLLENAEAALEQAKKDAVPYLFYARDMNSRVAEKLELERKLRRAVEQNEFVLHYQPQLHLSTGRISGLEALLRWNAPDEGLVQPLAFIHLLEETGMVLKAGRWALDRALADACAWQSNALPFPRVAVNLSPVQLQQKQFVDWVRESLEGSRVPAAMLELEITETVIMQDIDANIAKLKKIRDLGVEVVIDDFGTGYSSLNYLAKLPISAVKVDRSFVANMIARTEDAVIVSSIISLAHSLGLRVVAEGVETSEQADLLRRYGCDEVQGFLFHAPMPADRLEALFGRERQLRPESSLKSRRGPP